MRQARRSSDVKCVSNAHDRCSLHCGGVPGRTQKESYHQLLNLCVVARGSGGSRRGHRLRERSRDTSGERAASAARARAGATSAPRVSAEARARWLVLLVRLVGR